MWQQLTKLQFESIFNDQGKIKDRELRDYIAQETSMDASDKFLTDFIGALQLEVGAYDEIPPDVLSQLIKVLVLKQANQYNVEQFTIVPPGADSRDPFSVRSDRSSGSTMGSGSGFVAASMVLREFWP